MLKDYSGKDAMYRLYSIAYGTIIMNYESSYEFLSRNDASSIPKICFFFRIHGWGLISIAVLIIYAMFDYFVHRKNRPWKKVTSIQLIF